MHCAQVRRRKVDARGRGPHQVFIIVVGHLWIILWVKIATDDVGELVGEGPVALSRPDPEPAPPLKLVELALDADRVLTY